MEMIDLYDENRKFTGEVVARGTNYELGKYKLSVHMWITNSQGEIYVQKRSAERKLFPNKWENPGGGVVSGQDSLTTLFKEFQEELGVPLTGKHVLFKTLKRQKDFVDIYHIVQDFEIANLKLQVEEVAEAKWVSMEELEKMIADGDFCPTIMESLTPFKEYLKAKK